MTYPNSLKTHCPKGHPYDKGNTMWCQRKNGNWCRKCAACKRERENRANWARRAERTAQRKELGSQYERLKRWAERNPEKEAAYRKVYTAIRNGTLIRAKFCAHCGKTDCRIEASHNDYAHPLIVEWLCVMCHRRKDRKYKLPEEQTA